MTCVLPNRRYFGSVADKVASEALAASHHVHSHQQAKETRSGLDATGSPRLSRRKRIVFSVSRSRVRPVRSVDTPGPWLPGCCRAVRMLSREKIFFAQAHFLESTNQNTNVNTKKFPKMKTDESFRVAVKRMSGGCHEAVGQKSSQF